MQLSASVIASNSIAGPVCFGNVTSAVRPPLADIQDNAFGQWIHFDISIWTSKFN